MLQDKLTERAVKVLLEMVEHQAKVEAKTNQELARILLDIAHLPEHSADYSRLVECAHALHLGPCSTKSNQELALFLVDSTGELPIQSLHFQVLMEAAYRLDPEGFEKA